MAGILDLFQNVLGLGGGQAAPAAPVSAQSDFVAPQQSGGFLRDLFDISVPGQQINAARDLRRQRAQQRLSDARDAAAFDAIQRGDVGRAVALSPQRAGDFLGAREAQRSQENDARKLAARRATSILDGLLKQPGADPGAAFDRIDALTGGGLFDAPEERAAVRDLVSSLGADSVPLIEEAFGLTSDKADGKVRFRFAPSRNGTLLKQDAITGDVVDTGVPIPENFQFLEAGPGIVAAGNKGTGRFGAVTPTAGVPAGAPAGASAAQPQGGVTQVSTPASSPGGISPETVAGAEGLVAGTKQRAENEANQLRDIQNTARGAFDLQASIGQSLDLLRTGVPTGPASQLSLPIRRALVNFGVANSEEDLGNISAQEALQSAGNIMALQVRSPDGPLGGGLPGAASDRDLEFLKNSVPGLQQTPNGNQLIGELFLLRLERQTKMAAWMERQFNSNGRLPTIDEQAQWIDNQPDLVPDSVKRRIDAALNTSGVKEDRANLRAVFDKGF